MSRIGQLQEHARMRSDIDALRKSMAEVCAGMSDVINQVASLRAAIDNLRAIGNRIESPRGPGRPRRGDDRSAGIRDPG